MKSERKACTIVLHFVPHFVFLFVDTHSHKAFASLPFSPLSPNRARHRVAFIPSHDCSSLLVSNKSIDLNEIKVMYHTVLRGNHGAVFIQFPRPTAFHSMSNKSPSSHQNARAQFFFLLISTRFYGTTLS